LPEGKRVIDHRRKKIYRLNHREIGCNPINARIIRGGETNQQILAFLLGQTRQHRMQKAGRQLARAASGFDVCGQPHHA